MVVITSSVQPTRAQPQALPANVTGVQPNVSLAFAMERAWGRLRRRFLRSFRPGYVARMRAARRGECHNCPHDVIDSRDLKFCRNTCGYSFDRGADRFAWRDRLLIARAGWAEVVLFGGGALLAAAGLALWSPLAAVPPAVVALFVLAFFRDPPRRIPAEPGLVVSPADGRVTDVTPVEWLEEFDGPAVRVGIYLSIFNVHVNRCPDAARVIAVAYRPGQFLDVRRPSAAEVNERFSTLLEAEVAPHHLMLVRQIAGAFASRVVNEARPGRVLARGEKFGMIKFGSRTELYLPAEVAEIVVQVGDRVRGGSTPVARFSPEPRKPRETT
jgi:phosphatidylserine decarboxylase